MSPVDGEPEPTLTTEEDLQAAAVEKVIPHDDPITLTEYDPQWPALFDREAARIRAVLGDTAARVEHVGSTSGTEQPLALTAGCEIAGRAAVTDQGTGPGGHGCDGMPRLRPWMP